MDFNTLKETEAQYVLQTYGRNDIFLDHGQGARVWDAQGKEYIDLTSGIGVLSLGQNHPALSAALSDQAQKLLSVSNLFYSEPMVQAASCWCRHPA